MQAATGAQLALAGEQELPLQEGGFAALAQVHQHVRVNGDEWAERRGGMNLKTAFQPRMSTDDHREHFSKLPSVSIGVCRW